jgi:hypothetical protein
MTTALEGGVGSASCLGRSLPPGKTWYPLYRRLGGPQGQSGQVWKISPPPAFNPRTVQPVASRYTDYATQPKPNHYCIFSIYWSKGTITGLQPLQSELLIQNQDHVNKTNHCRLKTMVFRLWIIWSDSYTTTKSFLPAILEQKVGSRWNLLQKHCLFIPVLCMSNLPQPQKMAHVLNIRFTEVLALLEQHAVLCYPPWLSDLVSPDFFFGGFLKERVYRKKFHNTEALKGNIQLEITKTQYNVLRRNANNMQCCNNTRKWPTRCNCVG